MALISGCYDMGSPLPVTWCVSSRVVNNRVHVHVSRNIFSVRTKLIYYIIIFCQQLYKRLTITSNVTLLRRRLIRWRIEHTSSRGARHALQREMEEDRWPKLAQFGVLRTNVATGIQQLGLGGRSQGMSRRGCEPVSGLEGDTLRYALFTGWWSRRGTSKRCATLEVSV
jgi:hypothetical protein